MQALGAALAIAAAVKRLEVGEQLTEWRRVLVADDNFRAFQDLVKKDDAKAGGHSQPRGESLAEKLSRLIAMCRNTSYESTLDEATDHP